MRVRSQLPTSDRTFWIGEGERHKVEVRVAADSHAFTAKVYVDGVLHRKELFPDASRRYARAQSGRRARRWATAVGIVLVTGAALGIGFLRLFPVD